MRELCDLCRKEERTQNSHLIPASLYRLARNIDPSDGLSPDPVIVGDGFALQTSLQLTAPLLCPTCEDTFSKHGERTVIKQCLRSDTGKFELRDTLRTLPPGVPFDDSSWFSGTSLGELIKVDAYTYFAASMFWRASTGRWTAPGALAWRSALGPRYQEKFRQFLLGSTSFPSEGLLAVFVANEEPTHWFISVPSYSRKNGFHVHKFCIPAIEFRLFLGRRIEPQIVSLFARFRTNTLFVLDDSRTRPGFGKIGEWVRSSRPKGRLASSSRKQAGA